MSMAKGVLKIKGGKILAPKKLILLKDYKNFLTRLSEFSRHYNKWSKDTWQIGSELNCYDKTPQKDHNAKIS